jgi:16S rRNA (cytosine1402-N4)-methyltransferase
VVEAIIDARGSGLLSRTHSFAQVIEEALGSAVCNRLKINPATRSFQGVRIAINKELESITEGLESAFKRLKVGGVLVAISFHSLEDRIVKRFFRRLAGRPEHRKDSRVIEERTVLGKMISTKAVKADEAEICKNPRSRSARMRGIKKLGAEMGLGIVKGGSQS